MAAALVFHDISKEYRSALGRRRHLALDGVSFAVEQGEIFGFLGANGAGKTTAMHIAMGFTRATSGRGEMLGRSFGNVRTHSRIGFLGENFALYSRPADSLLRFYGALNGMADPELRDRVREVLRDVDLLDRSRDNVKRMSRGMQQRIGLAQALVNDPELLILDEPTSALDPFARIAVRELLMSARRKGKTIFLSSHLLSEVETVCDRVAILRKGRLVRVAALSDLLEESETVEIVARGIEPHAFGSATSRDGVATISVSRQAQRETIERIWAAGGEVVSVNPARRSLEDAFVGLADPNGREGLQ